MTEDIRNEVVTTYLKQVRLSRMARDCESLAREAERRGLGYLGYLQALLEGELAQRHEQQLRQRLKAAAFPYQKRLEDFDFSLVPCLPKIRLLELAQGAFLTAHDNVLFIGPSGLGKTHLTLGLGESALLGWLSGAVSLGSHAGHGTGSRPQGVAVAAAASAVSPL